MLVFTRKLSHPLCGWLTCTHTHTHMLSMHCTHATQIQTCMPLTMGLKSGYHVTPLELNKCIKMYHGNRRCMLWIVKDGCMSKAAGIHLSSMFLIQGKERSIRVWADQPHYGKTGIMPQIQCWSYSTPGERRRMYLPWKWSYRSSTQNIKQCLVCCLLKSRTNSTEARQHHGCTWRR